MSKNLFYTRFLLPFVLLPTLLQAQALYPVSFEEKASAASTIIEGKVIAQESFWNDSHTMIFTTNSIQVFKVFKGQTIADTLEVVTNGGTIGGYSIRVHELLSLRKGDLGVFFCQPAHASLKSPISGRTQLEVSSSSQGFLKYDLASQTASAPFAQYGSITRELYQQIINYTGSVFENRNPAFVVEAPAPQRMAVATNITSFSPTTVYAGALDNPANNLLTITGSGFGATPSGSAGVSFDDANDGAGNAFYTVAFNNDKIVSWTDTEIKVRVPDAAGTGDIRILDNTGATIATATGLTVLYSILNADFSTGGPVYSKEYNLMNTNNSGGYSIYYSTNTTGSGVNFNSSGAKATFQRALTTWYENAGINFIEGGSSANAAVAEDGVNLVVYDNTNAGAGVTPLPTGVLAACYSYVSMCTPLTTNKAQILEFDIIVRNAGVSSGSTTFNLGPCPPLSGNTSDVDMETVLLHELGHAIGLGHINDTHQGGTIGYVNPAKVMNYSIVYSIKRSSLDYSALMGALYCVNQQGNSYGSCGLNSTEMTPLGRTLESRDNCPGTFPSTTTPTNTTLIFDLAHANSNKYEDPGYLKISSNGTGRGITNTAYFAFKTGPLGGVLSLSITGYTTTPGSYTCPNYALLSLPTKGVELALYQTSTCPNPASFPAPTATRFFDGNGPLADITGLLANTTYLLLVDGVENTKASFNLTFTGASLPTILERFDGKSTMGYNDLNWSMNGDGIVGAQLEKSTDGLSFSPLLKIGADLIKSKKAHRDWEQTPLSYYRLALNMEDGTHSYSKTILLKRELPSGFHVYPNPAKDFSVISYKDLGTGKMQLTIRNVTGQLLHQESFESTGSGTLNLNTGFLKNGSYRVSLYDSKGQAKAHSLLMIQGQ